MDTPPGYVYAMQPHVIAMVFPKLVEHKNFEFKSRHDESYYNCVAFALGVMDEWKQLPSKNPDDYTIANYIEYFEKEGFEVCDNDLVESGMQKIALYEKEGIFKHVAIQVNENLWKSKIGDWEDIEHTDLDSISCDDYGSPIVFMKKKIKNSP